MDKQKQKNKRRQRRKLHTRKKVIGTAEKPRLSVFRSNRHIYIQLIDDEAAVTMAASSTMTKEARETLQGKSSSNKEAAVLVGKMLAEKALAAGISTAVFDRNGYKFHGRVKDLAAAVREAGLKL